MAADIYYAQVRRSPWVVGYWRLNEGAGILQAVDWASRFALTGTYTSRSPGPALLQNDPGAGSSLLSAGSMAVTDVAPLRIVGDIALEVWLAPYASQTVLLAGKQLAGVAGPYALRLNAGALQFALGNGTTEVALAGPAIPLSIPSYVLATCFRGRMNIYVAGAPVAAGNLGAQAVTDRGTAFTTGSFNGLMAELALYSGALSARRAARRFAVGQQIISDPSHYTLVDPPTMP